MYKFVNNIDGNGDEVGAVECGFTREWNEFATVRRGFGM